MRFDPARRNNDLTALEAGPWRGYSRILRPFEL
jgi:hypothetical protein